MPNYLITCIHLLAGITLIGGLAFVLLVLKPALRGVTPESQRVDILCRAGRRFRTLTWVSVITLILTGAYSMLNESASGRFETTWGVVLLVKLFVFAIAFGLLLIHDFILDPYASFSTSTSNNPRASSKPERAGLIQQAIFVLTLGVLLIASYLTTI